MKSKTEPNRTYWIIGGAVAAVIVVVFAGLAVLGFPTIGNVFSNVTNIGLNAGDASRSILRAWGSPMKQE